MKNLLLFMVDFFQYKDAIVSEMKNQSFDVTWFSDEVQLSFFEKAISKVFPIYRRHKFDNYFRRAVKSVENKDFDLVVIIFAAKFFESKHIELLKKTFPKAKVVYYAWDSVKNFKSIRSLISASDISFTFDRGDSIKYKAAFLPLFYCSHPAEEPSKGCTYDAVTVMSFYKEKYQSFQRILSALPEGVKTNFVLKLPNKLYYYRLKFFHPFIFAGIKNHYTFSSLKHDEVNRLLSASKTVIDCPLPYQQGLTIRTFESLAQGKKIITTNADIENYDFYNQNNIFVIKSDGQAVPKTFFETDFQTSPTFLREYSISSFVRKITSAASDQQI